jgi:hypothetical protein
VPLTTNGLTSRVTQIEQQHKDAARKANKSLNDVSSAPNRLQNQRLALSDEIAADKRTTDERSPQSEDDLRRIAFEKVQRMTKKG